MDTKLHRFHPPEQEKRRVDDYHDLYFGHDCDLHYDDYGAQKSDHDVFYAPDFHSDYGYDAFGYGLDCDCDLFFSNLSHYT